MFMYFLSPINTRHLFFFALFLLYSQLAPIILASHPPNEMSATHIHETHPSETVVLSNPKSAAADSGSAEESRSFIITLKKDTTKEQMDKYEAGIIANGGSIKHRYDSIIMKGFAVSVAPSHLQSFQVDPNVTHVEPDGEVHI